MVRVFDTMARDVHPLIQCPMKPSVQYNTVGQSTVNYAGNDFAANQCSNPAIFLSPLLSGAYQRKTNFILL
jgi:hypothetical protein